MTSATLYGLDNCDTCKKARNWLVRFGVGHEFVDYRAQRIAPETASVSVPMIARSGWPASLASGRS